MGRDGTHTHASVDLERRKLIAEHIQDGWTEREQTNMHGSKGPGEEPDPIRREQGEKDFWQDLLAR